MDGDELPAPPWRDLLDRALRAHEHTPTARYAQLATVREDGRPANRTIVFRAFLDPGGRLAFTTDARSAKVRHLAANPWAELCWSFPETREQFRLLGRARVVPEPADRSRAWALLSAPSRQSFTWPDPGAPRSDDAAFNTPVPPEPPPSFAVLVLDPERVEHLDLRPQPQSRTVFRLVGCGWTAEAVNP